MARLIEIARSLPLARKILIINGVIAMTTGMLTLGLILMDQYLSARTSLVDNAQLATRIAAQGLAAPLNELKLADAEAVLNTLRSKPNVLAAALYSANGRLLTGVGGKIEIPRRREVEAREEVLLLDRAVEARAPVMRGGERIGTAVMWVGVEGLYHQVIADSYPLLVMAMVGSVTIVLLVWLFLPMALRRLAQLTEVMRTVTRDNNYATRAHVRGQDEIGELANAFNTMLDEIQQRDENLRRELNERKRAQKQTAYLANHDVVTGLPNRRFFGEAVAHALEEANCRERQAALLLIDIDNFKAINDSLGHHAGDQLLIEVGNRIRSVTRASDLVCRVGGDEFGVILDAVRNEWQVEELGRNVIQAVLQPFWIEGTEVATRASAGIALATKDMGAEELRRNADTAMHQAKGSGQGLVRVFRPYMNDRLQHRLAVEHALRKALELNQLNLYYQPQVHTVSRHLVGVEALVRWKHPKLGEIPPSQFIPLAEETGIIVPLGEWAMRRASMDARAWQTQGLLGVPVSVNVSARQFLEPNFIESVLNTLKRTGLDGRLLELELTESILFDRHGTERIRLNALRQQGVALAIDDFGTGYSSMSYLKRFPIQRLKIDRSFIKNIPHESDDMAIAGAVIALGHKMGLEVVAEGVETKAQYDFLVDQACDRVQGFLFSRPLPVEELIAHFGERKTEYVSADQQAQSA
jgi:diguanylate cyclase (GGDEF)-like protein